ncbi:restriction endonuclease subunit S [Pseudoalteromonas prydzensis]|uniref:Restriction endonuclease subunit S n=2 Tax=Pseudoalteromonas TaxID=53246 RepID=A0ABR9FMR3_9GAMM|nr:restriction endonuclease subunit S [Pseudoalteromonas prydzensis]
MLAKFIDYRGRTPKKTPNGIPLITAKNIRDGYINREPREYIAESDYEDWMTRGIPNVGDVVITTEAPMGNVAVIDIDEKFALAQRAICLQCYEPETGSFLHYALRNPIFQKLLTLNATGTTVSGIKAATLRKLNIPFPPLAEQKVIADKLDTLLAQVETTKARLDHIPKILKTFRQSVLAAAVSGKLTESFEGDSVGSGIIKFEEILKDKKQLSYGVLKPGDLDPDGVPMIRIMDVGEWGKFNDSEIFKISKSLAKQYNRTEVQQGDIVLSVMATIGRPAIIPEHLAGANVNRALAVIKIKKGIVPEYIQLQLLSPFFQTAFVDKQIGTAQKRINLSDLRKFDIWVPSYDKQTEIVRRVEDLFVFADNIEQKANAALERVNNLTQSILAKAFRGELTADWRAQNPDLIIGDNSAEALLEKIKAEREANKNANKEKEKGTRKAKPKKEIQPKILLENPVVDVLNKKGIAKPQAIFDELKELMDLREVLKEISQLLEQQVIKEIDKDGQQYLEINR